MEAADRNGHPLAVNHIIEFLWGGEVELNAGSATALGQCCLSAIEAEGGTRSVLDEKSDGYAMLFHEIAGFTVDSEKFGNRAEYAEQIATRQYGLIFCHNSLHSAAKRRLRGIYFHYIKKGEENQELRSKKSMGVSLDNFDAE